MDRIFDIWPTLAELAKDLGKPYTTVAAWRQRGSIPARYDLAIISAAKHRGHTLTLEQLAECRCPRVSRRVMPRPDHHIAMRKGAAR